MPGSFLAKLFILAGIGLILIGIIIYLYERVPVSRWFPIGKLPGDLYIQKKGYSLYFPITSCILLSIILSLVLWILFRK
ncbi:MAG: DUF2905 family protein [bacterium]